MLGEKGRREGMLMGEEGLAPKVRAQCQDKGEGTLMRSVKREAAGGNKEGGHTAALLAGGDEEGGDFTHCSAEEEGGGARCFTHCSAEEAGLTRRSISKSFTALLLKP